MTMLAGKALLHGYNGSPRYSGQLPKAEPRRGGVPKLQGWWVSIVVYHGDSGVVSIWGVRGAASARSYRDVPCLQRLASAMVGAGVVCGRCRAAVLAIGGVSREFYERSVLGGACHQRDGWAGEVDDKWVFVFERHSGERWMHCDLGLAAATGCCAC